MTAGRLIVPSLEKLEPRRLLSAGSLDSTFAGGSVLRDFLNGHDVGYATAVDPDGKVLVAGRAYMGLTGNDFAVARFNRDGTIDTTFGTGGIVTTHLGSSSDSAYAIALQSDGKIVVAGEVLRSGTSFDFAVVRYNGNGTLDTTFGTNGIVLTDIAGGSDQARALAITASGRIVVAGSAVASGLPQFTLVAYTSSGALDSTFGSGGKTVSTMPGGYGRANSIAQLPSGGFVVGGSGYSSTGDGLDLAAARFTADGTLDPRFGASGFVRIDLPGETDETAAAVAVQLDGRIVLAGTHYDWNSDVESFIVARLNADGALDTTFGSGGAVLTHFGGYSNVANDMVLQRDGRIIVAGTVHLSGRSSFGVARFNGDGSIDSSFGTTGRATFALGSEAGAHGLAIDRDGHLLVAGYARNAKGNFDFAVARVIGSVNVAPVADAGGPYVVDSGSTVMLDGSASFDPDGHIVSYEWDFDYDGVSFTSDAGGSTVAFDASGITGPHERTIALRVTDSQGAMHIVVTTITVNPLPPPPEPEPPPLPQPEPQPMPEPEPAPPPAPGTVIRSPNPDGGQTVINYGSTKRVEPEKGKKEAPPKK